KTANDHVKRAYGYRYDALNRITRAIGNTHTSNYNLGTSVNPVQYDKNGNITRLHRKGYNPDTQNYEIMDDLEYEYENNKLTKVLDNGNNNFGFKDGANTNHEY